MSQYFELHPQNPQLRLIRRAAEIARGGGLIVYPTDSCYALGCHIGDKDALDRIRRIRDADRHHHFTLMCRDLTEIARYAKVENWQFRMVGPIEATGGEQFEIGLGFADAGRHRLGLVEAGKNDA